MSSSGPETREPEALILVGAGFFQRATVLAARREGYVAVTIDRDPIAPGAQEADVALVTSAHDPDSAGTALDALGPELPKVAGVLSAGARGCTYTAAVLARRFGTQGLELGDARVLSDKALLRQRLSEARLNTRPFEIVEERKDAERLLAERPVVLKPTTTSGGLGVALAKDLGDLERAWEAARAATEEGPILVEEYIPGRDVGVVGLGDSCSATVVSVLDRKDVLESGFGRPGLYEAPSSLDRAVLDEIEELAVRACAELGIRVGPFYAELRVPDDGPPQVIEVEAAVPGSFIGEYLVPRSTGADFLGASIRAVAGRRVSETWQPRETAICRFIYGNETPTELTDLSLTSLDGARGSPSKALVLSGKEPPIGRLLRALRLDAE